MVRQDTLSVSLSLQLLNQIRQINGQPNFIGQLGPHPAAQPARNKVVEVVGLSS
jgi:hypothetical protein